MMMSAVDHKAPGPTRVVKPLFKALSRDDRMGRRKLIMMALCDNGRTYTVTELAEIVGIGYSPMSYRFTTMGWNHPDILGPPCRIGSEEFSRRCSNRRRQGTSEWSQLSGKSRKKRLPLVRPPGRYEREALSAIIDAHNPINP